MRLSLDSTAPAGTRHHPGAVEEFTGHTRQYLWGLEQGKRNPTVVTLFELARALSRSPIDLITPEGEAGQRQMRRAPRARKQP